MARTSIPILDLQDYLSDDPKQKASFVQALGEALTDIGFFSLTNHGIDLEHIDRSYEVAQEFFELPYNIKEQYENKTGPKQRGFIPFGIEHAKGNASPDLKEFWQTGRVLDETHPLYGTFPNNECSLLYMRMFIFDTSSTNCI